MLQTKDYAETLSALLAGGPGSGRHKGFTYWEKSRTDYEKEYPGSSESTKAWVKRYSEPVDPKKLLPFREYNWSEHSSRTGSEHWEQLLADVKKYGVLDPVILRYFPDVDKALIIEGNHRIGVAVQAGLKSIPVRVTVARYPITEHSNGHLAKSVPGYKAKGEHIPADLLPSQIGLETVKDLKAGGPGSGWTTENGHVKHDVMKADALVAHLQSLSKNPLPSFVKKAAVLLEAAGLDKRYFENRQMSKFRTADKLAIHPLAIANYNEAKRMLEFRNDAGKDDVTHELAHHLDLTFVRNADKQDGDKVHINKAVADKIVKSYTAEWQNAKDNLSQQLGHRFRFANDYQKMEGKTTLTKNLPTLYAVDGPKEWFAESFSQYVKGGRYQERIERIAPQTAAAIKMVLTGRIFS